MTFICTGGDFIYKKRKRKRQGKINFLCEGPLYLLLLMPPYLPLGPFNPPINLIFLVLDDKAIRANIPPSSTHILSLMAS